MSAPAEKLLNSAYTLSVAYGLRVFPCAVKDKRPATAHGFQDATTDPSKLSSWWSTEPYNIGIATGGGLVVLDVDTGNGKRYHRTYIAPSAQRLGYDLKALDAPLYERDRILHSTTKNGNAGKIH